MPQGSSAQRVVEDLRVALFRQKISQEAVAAATGKSQTTNSRRFNGDVSPTIDEIEEVAAVAGLQLNIELVPIAIAKEPAA
jgi:transcriptional regulator with XRE-family HTH domain